MTVPEGFPGAMRLVLDADFEDMESFVAAVGGWELDFRQLDRGPLIAHAAVLAGEGGAILRVDFDRRFHQLGSVPPGMRVLGIPEIDLSWHGVAVGAGSVLDFNGRGGFDGVTEAGFSGVVLMLGEAMWRDVAAEEGVALDGEESEAEYSWPATREIGQLHARLVTAFEARPGSRATEALDREAARVLLGELAGRRRGGAELEPDARRKSVQRAVEILEDQTNLPVGVAQLARSVGVSPPTLYRAFVSELGVSPKRYIQSRSLAGARRGLLSAPVGTHVADVANEWGFWHMSQFAADYQRQFGELPSETLTRR